MSKLTDRLRRQSRGPGHNAKGRSKRRDRFVKLDHWLQDTEAWRSLRPAPRALYIELVRRYNSFNNGGISMSVREAARLLHIAKDTATRAFRELEEKGFVKPNLSGSFHWKFRHATTWILTAYDMDDDPATKDFARWKPAEKDHGPKTRTTRPKSGTFRARIDDDFALTVLHLGLWTTFAPIFGPRLRHAYSLPCHARKLAPTWMGIAHPEDGAETPNIAAPDSGCAARGPCSGDWSQEVVS